MFHSSCWCLRLASFCSCSSSFLLASSASPLSAALIASSIEASVGFLFNSSYCFLAFLAALSLTLSFISYSALHGFSRLPSSAYLAATSAFSNFTSDFSSFFASSFSLASFFSSFFSSSTFFSSSPRIAFYLSAADP